MKGCLARAARVAGIVGLVLVAVLVILGIPALLEARSRRAPDLDEPPVAIAGSGVGSLPTFSPDGRWLALGGGDEVRLWDPATGRPAAEPFAVAGRGVQDLAFSPDGRLLAVAATDRVQLWDPEAGTLVRELILSTLASPFVEGVAAVAFSPDGRTLASSSQDPGTPPPDECCGVPHAIHFWDVATGAQAPGSMPVRSRLSGLAFSPDGGRLASVDSTGVQIWDVATRTPVGGPLAVDGDGAYDVAFSPDGSLLSATSPSGGLELWADLGATPPAPHRLGHPTSGGRAASLGSWHVAFSPDGHLLAASSPGGVTLWDTRTGAVVAEPTTDRWYQGIGGAGLAFSPDGDTLAVSRSSGVDLWPTPENKPD
jgi:WD40 repeat protein